MTDKQWEYLGNIELAVPSEIVDTYGPGPWDEAAAVFGPQLAELNPDIQWENVALELDGYGLDRDWDEQSAWEYAAWIIAGDIYDRKD
jgi:hypothetical protein